MNCADFFYGDSKHTSGIILLQVDIAGGPPGQSLNQNGGRAFVLVRLTISQMDNHIVTNLWRARGVYDDWRAAFKSRLHARPRDIKPI